MSGVTAKPILGLVSQDEAREIILSRVESNGECWQWARYCNPTGYGRVYAGGRLVLAHRLAYFGWKGDPPKGYDLDHLCRNRGCCNPCHMEAVPHRDNVLRGLSPTSSNARKTHCVKGHDLSDHYVQSGGGRGCKVCAKQQAARWHAEKKARDPEGFERMKRAQYERSRARKKAAA